MTSDQSPKSNVIDIEFYRSIRDGLKKEGRPAEGPDFQLRIRRIKESIERLDRLMKELKEGGTERAD